MPTSQKGRRENAAGCFHEGMDNELRSPCELNPPTARLLDQLGFARIGHAEDGTLTYRRSNEAASYIELRASAGCVPSREEARRPHITIQLCLTREDGILASIILPDLERQLTIEEIESKLPQLIAQLTAAQEMLRDGPLNYKAMMRRTERQIIDLALRVSDRMVTHAAHLLGVKHQTLSTIIRTRHADLTSPRFRNRRRSPDQMGATKDRTKATTS